MFRKLVYLITGIKNDLAIFHTGGLLALLFFAIMTAVLSTAPSEDLATKDRFQQASAILLILASFPLAWITFQKGEHPRVPKILRSYIFIAIAFGAIYFLIYFQLPKAFTFSSNIALPAAATRSQEVSEEIHRLLRIVIGVNELTAKLATESDEDFSKHLRDLGNQSLTLDSQKIARVRAKTIVAGDVPMTVHWISIEDSFGKVTFDLIDEFRLRSFEVYNPGAILISDKLNSRTEANKALLEISSRINRRIEVLIKELDARERLHFSVVDFLYFSFVTVTTLGYGDIIPNSTIVRVLVVLQILLGVSLIARTSAIDSIASD